MSARRDEKRADKAASTPGGEDAAVASSTGAGPDTPVDAESGAGRAAASFDGRPPTRPEPTRRQRRADRKRGDALAAAALASGASGSGTTTPSNRGRAFRLPALLVIVAALVAGVVLQGRLAAPGTQATTVDDLGRSLPTATPARSSGSTWFCAGGTAYGTQTPSPPGRSSASSTSTTTSSTTTTTARPAGTTPGSTPGSTARPGTTLPGAEADTASVFVVAEHTVIIANADDRTQSVVVTVYPSEGASVAKRLDVQGHSRTDLTLSDVVKAPFASATVEAPGGLVSVQHRLQGPLGRTVGACATSPSSDWYFPAGTTRPGTREIFVAFNPFPERAVLDFGFQVEDEAGRQTPRESNKLTGKVVPPNSVVAIDITAIITVSPQVATVVRTREGQGRVIVDRLVVSDGTNDQPKGLAVTLGAPVPMPSWVFADGPALAEGVRTSYVVYNPSGDTVEADLLVQPDAQAIGAETIPITTSIRPGSTATVAVSRDTPGTTNSGYWVSVQSRDDKPIVVERVVRSDAPAPRVAPSFTIGSPVVANQWIVAAAGGTGQASGQIAVTNLSPTSSVVLSVAVAGGGATAPVAGFDQVELLAGRRTLVDLSSLPGADGASSRLLVTVNTSGPVVVEQTTTFADPASVSDLVAVPVRDTLARPPADLAAEAAAAPLPTIPGTGTVPFQTVPPLPTIPPATDDPGTSLPPDSQPAVPGGDASTTTIPLDPATPTTAGPGAPGT